MEGETTLKWFGHVAIDRGFVTLEELVNALNIQAMDKIEKKKHRRIGEILLQQGLMTSSQIGEVLAFLEKNYTEGYSQ
ncbi:MAG: hypothetical protein R6V46_09685 [Desulfatiglandaceae bacterium]